MLFYSRSLRSVLYQLIPTNNDINSHFPHRKISFKNYEERVIAAEKICKEADQLRQLYARLTPNVQDETAFDALRDLTEILKLKDPSMLSLELAVSFSKYNQDDSKFLLAFKNLFLLSFSLPLDLSK